MVPSSPPSRPIRLLFVCLGNICRSPLAEGVFLDLVTRAELGDRYDVDSAGTGAWHAGEGADPRSVEVAERNGVRLTGCARQVEPEDFRSFDLILAMDHENLENLRTMNERVGGTARLALLREFDPESDDGREVPDPYYGGPRGFELVFEMVQRSCAALLHRLEVERQGDASPGTTPPG